MRRGRTLTVSIRSGEWQRFTNALRDWKTRGRNAAPKEGLFDQPRDSAGNQFATFSVTGTRLTSWRLPSAPKTVVTAMAW